MDNKVAIIEEKIMNNECRIRALEVDALKVSDPDNNFTAEDLIRKQEILEMELREQKADSQKNMAWVALWTMVSFTAFLFLPIFPDTRISALAEVLGVFYIALAGIVGAFMGVSAWMSRK